MKKLLINIGALICAVAILSGTTVFSAGAIPVVDVSAVPVAVEIEDDNFTQGEDLLIADLLNSGNDEVEAEVAFTEYEYSEPESSAPASSAKPQSSAPPKKPTSSAAPKPSSKAPSSTPPPPASSSEPPPPSSEDVPSSEDEPAPPSENYDNELLEKLAGAVQREIVGTNTKPFSQYYEAYKAQAVACHSYMEYHKARNGTYPTMSYSTPKQETINLVAEVLNELMYYNGSVINAAYHAASGGHTQSASYVWSGNISYLTGVESKYDDYNSTGTVAVSAVEQSLLQNGISVSGDPSSWFDLSGAVLTDGGFIDYIPVCGQQVKGRTLRENILGTQNIKSPKITDITLSGDSFIFSTMGYGHGTGMSQQGALGYSANEGWDYKTILTHYYTGITIE